MFFKVASAKKIGKVLLILLFSVLIFISAIYLFSEEVRGEKLPQNGITKNNRIEFLKELGYEVSNAEESKEIVIPYIFSDVYEEYNNLQKTAGYDLKKYSGKKVNHYNYKVLNQNRNDMYANLIVFNGSIIGGDISAISFKDGYMLPLIKNKSEN